MQYAYKPSMGSTVSDTPATEAERIQDEQTFLAGYDASRFPHPSVAVDAALLTVTDGALRVLLRRRSEHPHKGRWALPGGFVGIDEDLEDAVRRVLATKTAVGDGVYVEQLYTFGAAGRDPRTRVISVTYFALVPAPRLLAAIDNSNGTRLAVIDVPWAGETGGPVEARTVDGEPLPLAFDHADILGVAVKRLRGKVGYTPIGYELLPARFTLRDLQEVHESLLGRPLNKDSFRRKMLASGLIEATGEREAAVGHRPAALYRYLRS